MKCGQVVFRQRRVENERTIMAHGNVPVALADLAQQRSGSFGGEYTGNSSLIEIDRDWDAELVAELADAVNYLVWKLQSCTGVQYQRRMRALVAVGDAYRALT